MREVAEWLTERATGDDVRREAGRIRGWGGLSLADFLALVGADDEIWRYKSTGLPRLSGEEGFALVRGGRVVGKTLTNVWHARL